MLAFQSRRTCYVKTFQAVGGYLKMRGNEAMRHQVELIQVGFGESCYLQSDFDSPFEESGTWSPAFY